MKNEEQNELAGTAGDQKQKSRAPGNVTIVSVTVWDVDDPNTPAPSIPASRQQ
jgi:hypothetical protein